MISRIRAFMVEKKMIQPKDRILVGISGGADSVCLLFVLLELQKELDFQVSAVHVNHELRGAESQRDEDYVKRLCEELQIPLGIYHCPVQKRAERDKISLEEAGRLFRYEVFEQEAKIRGCNKIAVAHHGNDQAETVLFHLFRGTGLKGLSGMEPVRGNIIRPLLCVERNEIQAWLEARQIVWCTDSTNLEDAYTRNRIRHSVLECAQNEINTKAVRHMMQTAEEISETEAFLEEETRKAFRLCVREEKNECLIYEAGFKRLHPVIQGRLLRTCLGLLSGLKDVERQHIFLLQELMIGQTGKSLDLPGERKAQKEYEGLRIFHAEAVPVMKLEESELTAGQAAETEVCPQIPGKIVVDGQLWVFSLEKQEFFQGIPEKTYTKWFDYDKIERYLSIRTRKTGDFLEISREHKRKKLNRFLIDEKIPAREREHLRVLADGSHVLWVPGKRISERYKVTEETRQILKVQIYGGTENGRED